MHYFSEWNTALVVYFPVIQVTWDRKRGAKYRIIFIFLLLALCSSVNYTVNSWHNVTVEVLSKKVKTCSASLCNFTLRIYFRFSLTSFWFSSASGLLAFDSRDIVKAIMASGATQMHFPSTNEGLLFPPQCFLFHLHALENKDGCIMAGSSSMKRFQTIVL